VNLTPPRDPIVSAVDPAALARRASPKDTFSVIPARARPAMSGEPAVAHNLLRATGSLASLAYAKTRGATLRRDLIVVAPEPVIASDSPARTAGTSTLHYPTRIGGRLSVLTFRLTSC